MTSHCGPSGAVPFPSEAVLLGSNRVWTRGTSCWLPAEVSYGTPGPSLFIQKHLPTFLIPPGTSQLQSEQPDLTPIPQHQSRDCLIPCLPLCWVLSSSLIFPKQSAREVASYLFIFFFLISCEVGHPVLCLSDARVFPFACVSRSHAMRMFSGISFVLIRRISLCFLC